MNTCISGFFLLRIAYGLFFIVMGLDKFFITIDNWTKYVSPKIIENLPALLQGNNLLYLIGIIEIAIGLTILRRKTTRGGAYCAMILLIAISVNLFVVGGMNMLAIHDLVLAVGALTLAMLAKQNGTC